MKGEKRNTHTHTKGGSKCEWYKDKESKKESVQMTGIEYKGGKAMKSLD